MHEFYPLKPLAPAIIHRSDPTRSPAPSLSPDILIAYVNDPLNPLVILSPPLLALPTNSSTLSD
jgi:hypothetical protein